MKLSSFSPVADNGEPGYLRRVVYKESEFDNSAKTEGKSEAKAERQRYENVEIHKVIDPGSKTLQRRECPSYPTERPLPDKAPHNAIELCSASGEQLYVDMNSVSCIRIMLNNDVEMKGNRKSHAYIGRCSSIFANNDRRSGSAGGDHIYMELDSDNCRQALSNGDQKQYTAEIPNVSRPICIETMPERSDDNRDKQADKIASNNETELENIYGFSGETDPMEINNRGTPRHNDTPKKKPEITNDKQRVVSLKLVVVMCVLSILVSVMVCVAAEVVVHHVFQKRWQVLSAELQGSENGFYISQQSNDTDDQISRLNEEVQTLRLEILNISSLEKGLEQYKHEILKIKNVTNGGWAMWDTWDACSSSCGGGIQTRARLCDSPSPSLYGAACDGDYHETRFCNAHKCPVASIYFTAINLTDTSYWNSTLISSVQQSGNDYNNSTGTFKCSVEGLYHFAVQIHVHTTYMNNESCVVRKNQSALLCVYPGTDAGVLSGSSSVYVVLRIGDIVDLVCPEWLQISQGQSVFTGALIT